MQSMIDSTIEEHLAKTGKFIYSNKGVSMLPLIRQGGDLIRVEPIKGKLKKYDVVLYKRSEGLYVLHRIIKVRDYDYVICGDNCWTKEYVNDQRIIGVLTAVIRDGKEIPVTHWMYRLYVHLWCDLFPVRAFILHGISWIKRLVKK